MEHKITSSRDQNSSYFDKTVEASVEEEIGKLEFTTMTILYILAYHAYSVCVWYTGLILGLVHHAFFPTCRVIFRSKNRTFYLSSTKCTCTLYFYSSIHASYTELGRCIEILVVKKQILKLAYD